jgi:acetyl-CoA acyltransferase
LPPYRRRQKPAARCATTRPDDLAAAVIRALLEKYPQIPKEDVEDVILGCAMPEGEAGSNMARIAALRAGLPVTTPASPSIASAAPACSPSPWPPTASAPAGAHIIVAGGSESMSMIPMAGNKPAPNPWFVDHQPEIYINMGLTAEEVQRKYGVSREDADAFAYRSHQNALKAQAKEISPMRSFP